MSKNKILHLSKTYTCSNEINVKFDWSR